MIFGSDATVRRSTEATGLLPQIALAFLAAALISLSVRPWGSGYLAWIALLPLLVAVHKEHSIWRGGLAFGLASLGLTVLAFEGVVPAVAWAFPLLVLSQSAWFAAAGAGYVLLRNELGGALALAGFPLLLLAAEWFPAQRWIWRDLANPITRIGYTQFDTFLLPAAQLSGISGVSLLVLLTNLSLFLILFRRRRSAGVALLLAVTAVAISTSLPTSTPHTTDTLRVATVQGSASATDVLLGRFDDETARGVLEPYRLLTSRATTRGAELVIWPETLLPRPIWKGSDGDLINDSLPPGSTVLAGGIARHGAGTSNSAFLWEGGDLTEVYRKRALVPLVEDHYRPGIEVPPVSVGGLRLAIGICLDSAFPSFIRDSVLRGAQALVFLTDDSFAVRTVTPELHLRVSAFRAAEARKPAVFVSQAGPSAFIDQRGRVVSRLERGETAAELGDLDGNAIVTPYVRLGDWLGRLSTLLALFAVAYCVSLSWADLVRRRARNPSRGLTRAG